MFKKILIPTDGSIHSQKAERYGLEMAKTSHASVTVIHVVEVPFFPTPVAGEPSFVPEEEIEILKKAGEDMVNRVVEQAEKMGVKAAPVVVIGHPADQIIKYAKAHDLVVMGTMGKSGLFHLLMGSVTEKVVRHTPVPVLVIPADESQK
ncbi:MAG: universal stress protein, partial [Theionarchaea archaeon]|nr:universal stress protein [Theionarchaea archaeon]MBU7041239.1 universal stress protein [Theionarchaea archaeon]